MDFNLPEELQRRICFALIPAKSLCWPPKLSHYQRMVRLVRFEQGWKLRSGACTGVSMALEIQSVASRQEQITKPDIYFSFERQRRKAPARYANFASLARPVSRLTHRDIAASKVEPNVKSAQKIETEQSIHAACWGQCVAQSVQAAYPFSKRLNTFKGQLPTPLPVVIGVLC
jgi:hypothetical protein